MSQRDKMTSWLACPLKWFSSLLALSDYLINIPIHKIIPPFKINAIQHKTSNSHVLGKKGDECGFIYNNCHLFRFPHHLWLKPHVHKGKNLYLACYTSIFWVHWGPIPWILITLSPHLTGLGKCEEGSCGLSVGFRLHAGLALLPALPTTWVFLSLSCWSV